MDAQVRTAYRDENVDLSPSMVGFEVIVSPSFGENAWPHYEGKVTKVTRKSIWISLGQRCEGILIPEEKLRSTIQLSGKNCLQVNIRFSRDQWESMERMKAEHEEMLRAIGKTLGESPL